MHDKNHIINSYLLQNSHKNRLSMIHLKNKTVGDIVTENVNTAKIFHKYQIDFGFNGDMILKKFVKKRN